MNGDSRTHDEAGTTTIVLMAFISTLMMGALLIVTYASRDEVSAEARTSADAAALAGATVGIDDILVRIFGLPPTIPTSTCDSLGRGSASDYAQANGGELTKYCYDYTRGRATVTVRVRQEASGKWQYQEASARAKVFPTCEDPPEPTPTPSPTPTPDDDDPEPTPTPTPTPEPGEFCSLPGVADLTAPGITLGFLKDLMAPRLVDPDS